MRSRAPPRRCQHRLGGSPRPDLVEDFIHACEHALTLAFDADNPDVTPGVEVDQPRAMLKAYLLFLATWGAMAGDERLDAADVNDWGQSVTPAVWQLLGFDRPPTLLSIGLAFSLLGNRQHQAPELRALIWAVGDFAACNLMPGLRA